MSNLNLSIEPGFYLEPQTAAWEVGPGVEYIVFNQGGIPPAISEYVAYDTLTPPNPFIAVTQDGQGNVVYDGGFPKFYNGNAPAASNFSQLTAAFKFAYNALKWIANPEKVQAGNNKILILGDNPSNYRITGTDINDFKTSFDLICSIAGFVPTYKMKEAYAGGLINARLAELDEYCAVILMSSLSTTVPQITDQSASDLATFRTLGNGIMVITDHGQVVNSVSQAVNLTTNSFFATANKVITQFGAYFSGDYNRTPVNVGFLRSTHGDHPLYNGMDNSESIYAGGSESAVKLVEYPKFYPGSLPAVQLDQQGTNIVQAAALLSDGSVETYRGVFVIAEGDILQFTDDGDPVTSINIGRSSRMPAFGLDISLTGVGTLRGEITFKSNKIGEFTYTDETGVEINWLTIPTLIRVNNGDVVTAAITLPFNYSTQLTILRFQPSVSGVSSLAEMNLRVNPTGTLPNQVALRKALEGTGITPSMSTAECAKALQAYFDQS